MEAFYLQFEGLADSGYESNEMVVGLLFISKNLMFFHSSREKLHPYIEGKAQPKISKKVHFSWHMLTLLPLFRALMSQNILALGLK